MTQRFQAYDAALAAWSPGRLHGNAPAKTVIRAGYGWFFNRFTVPNFFSSTAGVPYVIQAIHDNGVNQQSYVVNNPKFYDPTAAAPPRTPNIHHGRASRCAWPPASVLKIATARAGVSVIALMAEMTIDAAIVKANC